MNLCKGVLFAILLGAAMGAKADSVQAVYVGPEGTMTLSDGVCNLDAVRAMVPSDRVSSWHAAIGTANGKDYKACWILSPPNVYIIWEDGDIGILRSSLFKRVTGV